MMPTNMRDIHISIVSHGQYFMVVKLLADLAQLACQSRLQLSLTLNINEPCELNKSNFPFPITLIKNSIAKGFGANHNHAFDNPPELSKRKYFVVINPDIRINEDVFSVLIDLINTAKQNNTKQAIGVISPAIKNNNGLLEDAARELPTPTRILKKFLGQRKHWQYTDTQTYQPDWIAGMFMLFQEQDFASIGGFNDSYFLYYEDVELCSRLWLADFCVLVDPNCSITHNAQRTSHKKLTYLRWHLGSMLRFFLSNVYRQVKKLHQQRSLQP